MGLFCLCLLFECFWVFALLGLAVAYRICPSVEVVLRVRSSPDISIWDSLACLAPGPHRPFVSAVLCGLRLTRHMSHLLQRDLSFVVFWLFFGVWCLLFFWFVCLGVFGLFLVSFLVSFCFLHALALSLTGAQRTDSSFASKKKGSEAVQLLKAVWN